MANIFDPILGNAILAVGVIFFIFILLSMIRINQEWEESIILRFGKYDRTVKSGLYFMIPFGIERSITRDKRTTTIELDRQSVITADNVPVMIDAVAFITIVDVRKSITSVSNYNIAINKYAQTTLRNVLGQMSLDQLLEKRHEAALKIKDDLDKAASDWGIDVQRLELQDIKVPDDMQRIMARQAEAEREKRGVIIAAEGELEAAKNLAEASNILADSKYGYELRVLATISDVSQDQSNTVVFYPTSALDSGYLAAGLATKIPKPKTKS